MLQSSRSVSSRVAAMAGEDSRGPGARFYAVLKCFASGCPVNFVRVSCSTELEVLACEASLKHRNDIKALRRARTASAHVNGFGDRQPSRAAARLPLSATGMQHVER